MILQSSSQDKPNTLYIYNFANSDGARREGAGAYHWAFMLDKSAQVADEGTLYHVAWAIDDETKKKLGENWQEVLTNCDPAERPVVWEYKTRESSTRKASASMRGRVRLCNVTDAKRFERVMQSVHVDRHWKNMGTFSCRTWLSSAWRALANEPGLLEPEMTISWHTIEKTVKEYLEQKESQDRFNYDVTFEELPTWDLLEQRELVS